MFVSNGSLQRYRPFYSGENRTTRKEYETESRPLQHNWLYKRKEIGVRIDSTNLGMESARQYSSTMKLSVSTKSSFTNVYLSNSPLDLASENYSEEASETSTGVKEEQAGLSSLDDLFSQVRAVSNKRVTSAQEQLSEIRERCIMYLIDLLFPKERTKQSVTDTESLTELSQEEEGGLTEGTLTTIEIHSECDITENEETAFQATGTVTTADGRELALNMNVTMSRSFSQHITMDTVMEQISYLDPLVINLDGNIASLSDQSFFFDLDADGTEEEIASLNSGSGYLALDQNENGVIDDGTELFGTTSGNGFADLLEYDMDGNGWIDEADEIFDKLQIWTKDEDGNDLLYTLKEKEVGAICLQHVTTDFSLKHQETNSTLGEIRSTGMFLFEDGNSGTMQQLDLAI